MRGQKKEDTFPPWVLQGDQWTTVNLHSCLFPQLHIHSFISLKISFIWAMSFPITQLSALPQRLLACSDPSSLWVQPPGQFIPHSQDKTGWHVPTSVQPSAQSRTRQLWITQATWHCPLIFLFCFCSHQRVLSLPSSCKLAWDLKLFYLTQVPQPPSQCHSLFPFSSAISLLTSFITCCTSPPEHLVLNPQILSILCP